MARRSGGKLTPVTHGHIREYSGRFTGGGANAAMTAVSGTGYGISSIAHSNTADGTYIVTLEDGFQVLDSYAFATGAVGTATTMKVVSLVKASVNASAGTMNISCSDLAATPTLEDVATTEEVSVIIRVRSEGVYT